MARGSLRGGPTLSRMTRGQILILFALGLPALLGVVGMAIDAGFYMARRQGMQAAADMAALNGAYCGHNPASDPCAAAVGYPGSLNDAAIGMALATAKANGFAHGVGGVTVAVCKDVQCTPPLPADRIRVEVSLNHQTFFLPVVGISSVALSAVAQGQFQLGSTGSYALFAAANCTGVPPPYGLSVAANNQVVNGGVHSNGNIENIGNNNFPTPTRVSYN